MKKSKPKTTGKQKSAEQGDSSSNRRKFLQGSSMMLAGGAIASSPISDSPLHAAGVHVQGSDVIKLGLVGCGRRGTAAAMEALSTTGGDVELVAMGDLFAHHLQTAYRTIQGKHASALNVNDARFIGFDAYKRVLASDADVVLLATPPCFRPLQFEAAVNAGKHVFMEKPVATDAVGLRRVLAANQLAKHKGLGVQVGLQRRHEQRYRQCIDRLQTGAIGDLLFARAYWNSGSSNAKPWTPQQSELEYQIRNWRHFTWLCGDHINEQHIHHLDAINWLVGDHPIEACGVGGRQVRHASDRSQVFDHQMVEYTYANGFKLFSQCRRIHGCWNSISAHVQGNRGSSDISSALIRDAKGNKIWQSSAKEIRGKGWQQQQQDFFDALRKGEVPNEGGYGAQSTMTAILGRAATYSGKIVQWKDAIQSEVQFAAVDSICSLDDLAPACPNESGTHSSV